MMPTSVIPIWTVERNLPGSEASSSATCAPLLPRSAETRSRAGRAETIASSDIENKPLSRIKPAIIKTSVQGNGITPQALAELEEKGKHTVADLPA